MTERIYQKNAWILLFVLGIVGLFFALSALVTGAPADPQSPKSLTGSTWDELVARSPGVANLVRSVERAFGISLLGFSVFGMAVSAVSYRRWERWAWYVSWFVPILLIGFIVNNFGSGGVLWPLFMVLLIISLLGLFLPYRKFFPRKQA